MFSKIVENATNFKNKITQEIGDRLVRLKMTDANL